MSGAASAGAQDARRVLILSYHFPPAATVGSVRVGGLAKYLPRFGWEPVVVTARHPDRRSNGGTVLETEGADRAASIKRRLGLAPQLALKDQLAASGPRPSRSGRLRAATIEVAKAALAFPDANRGWVRHACAAAERAWAAGRFDLVLTTSPPVSVHLAGRRVRDTRRVPWVADLRDLWSQDHNSVAPAWRRALERRLERRTLACASGLVTVSEPLAESLRTLHPELPVQTILNGFDPESFNGVSRLTDAFTLTHAGTFYQGRRDPTAFLEAIAGLAASGRIDRRRFRVRLFSHREPWLSEMVGRLGLDDLVEFRGWVGRDEAIAAQRESQVLLLLHWGGESERGVYTGKIFEYLAARRPVLVVGGGEGVLAELLRETGAGVHARSREEVETHILRWWEEFEREGQVRAPGDPRAIERFAHPRMAGEFAALFDRLVAGRGSELAR